MTLSYEFSVSMTYQEFTEIYYGGGAQQLVVTATNGMRVAIPAGRMVPFVDSSGVRGLFRLTVDSQNKFKGLERLR
ncbi:uncharacterized protein DUF2835 [Idiomarina aquatica]|jgi:hypothetical protein|uniref:Uncharacterized protein DUF2835 n=1 Tax=Idiomarina aquatica TaxID=1327752 RepID=A0A4R6PQ67_9GAMM|nr:MULTISPECIES: DUF2835 family protein [Idiomarina]MAK70827.1 hypothetical protein [Idiomarinaceae bacterium]TDP40682.1 uncharacterized protein DUF2835 [Idiomarina aquatica]HAD47489.1 DUF2835 domain-containing protein [Idiomarina sp.]